VAGIMNVDDMEDYLELQDPALKKQIEQSKAEYRRGEAREVSVFLAELQSEAAKKRK
jgi:hypothetical protein